MINRARIEPLLRFAEIGSWQFDKNKNSVSIQSDSKDVDKLLKLQKTLLNEGVKSNVSFAPKTALFDKNIDKITNLSDTRRLIQISDFAKQNSKDYDASTE